MASDYQTGYMNCDEECKDSSNYWDEMHPSTQADPHDWKGIPNSYEPLERSKLEKIADVSFAIAGAVIFGAAGYYCSINKFLYNIVTSNDTIKLSTSWLVTAGAICGALVGTICSEIFFEEKRKNTKAEKESKK